MTATTRPLDLDEIREQMDRALAFIRSGAPASEIARMPSMFLAVGAMPALVDEVARLRKVIERERTEHAQWAFAAGQGTGEYIGQLQERVAELERALTRAENEAKALRR